MVVNVFISCAFTMTKSLHSVASKSTLPGATNTVLMLIVYIPHPSFKNKCIPGKEGHSSHCISHVAVQLDHVPVTQEALLHY